MPGPLDPPGVDGRSAALRARVPTRTGGPTERTAASTSSPRGLQRHRAAPPRRHVGGGVCRLGQADRAADLRERAPVGAVPSRPRRAPVGWRGAPRGGRSQSGRHRGGGRLQRGGPHPPGVPPDRRHDPQAIPRPPAIRTRVGLSRERGAVRRRAPGDPRAPSHGRSRVPCRALISAMACSRVRPARRWPRSTV